MTQTRHFLQDWADKLAAELELDVPAAHAPDLTSLLDVTRLIAHNVARPAGPVATYYIGLAAGLAAGNPETAAKATEIINELVAEHIAAREASNVNAATDGDSNISNPSNADSPTNSKETE